MLQKEIISIISTAFVNAYGSAPERIELVYPDPQFGDVALACHPFAKQFKTAPQEIASAVASNISRGLIVNVAAVAGYVNLTIDTEALMRTALSAVIEQDKTYGRAALGEDKIVIEYSSPNTNKPLHLGHIRNNVLGMALSRLLETQGCVVVKTQIINDRGIHIIKSMLAYQKWGANQTPEEAGEKGDHFVGKFYVMFEQEFEREWQEWLKDNPEVPGLSDEDRAHRRNGFFGYSDSGSRAQQMLRDWEAGDEAVRALWKRMNEWVYAGFNETYQLLGSTFDTVYYESDTYALGKDIIQEGLAKGIFTKEEDGSVWVDLSGEGLDRKILQRNDGTSVYITQDLGLAVMRQKEWNAKRALYVVGHEQEYHFKVLFGILKKLGYPWAENLAHVSHGLVFLPEGKMKSREGKVVDADAIIDEVRDLAFAEVKARFPEISETECTTRADMIGLGALKFFLLHVTPTQSIHFNPKEAIAFEGATGPYIQYAHARIMSILEQDTPLSFKDIDFSALSEPEEKQLALKLMQYPLIVSRAAGQYAPSMLCTYLLELSRQFNAFYHAHTVLRAPSKQKHARICLINAVRIVLRNGLQILGIESPEKM